MKMSQVAAQLYTVRDHTKTLADLTATLRRLRTIGYEAVQISAIGPIPPEQVRRVCSDEGLVICATHEDAALILDKPGSVVEILDAYGCEYTAYPAPNMPLTTREEVNALAGRLNAAGKVLRDGAKTLCYHNHHIEFRRVDGRTILKALLEKTDPELVCFEPDTYWVQYGGGDPVAWCQLLKGRMPLLHLKDYRLTADLVPEFAEIGHGNLDWQRIVEAAEASGCRWFIVEQDICPGDPFDSLRLSLEYIRAHIAV